MADRVLPNNQDAERGVLGAVMIGDADTLAQAKIILTPEMFYRSSHQKIFQAMIELGVKGDKPDIVTMVDHMGAGKDVDLRVLIAELASEMATDKMLEEHAKIVKNCSTRRDFIRNAMVIEDKSYDLGVKMDEVLDDIRTMEHASIETTDGGFVSAGSIVDTYLSSVEKARTAPIAIGLPTGINDLDGKLGGLKGGDMIVVGARPSVGKSALGLHLTRIATGFTGVGIVSLEMSGESLVNRMVSSYSGISGFSISTGDLDDVEHADVKRHAEAMKNQNVWIDTNTTRAEDLDARCAKIIRKHDVGLIVVDYIQLMESDVRSNSNDEKEISNISKACKRIAVKYDVVIVALAQLNRGLESRSDKRPMLSDLRGSGSLEQDADVVILMHRPAYYGVASIKGEDVTKLCELNVAKHRNGPIGMVKTSFDETTGRYTSWNTLPKPSVNVGNFDLE